MLQSSFFFAHVFSGLAQGAFISAGGTAGLVGITMAQGSVGWRGENSRLDTECRHRISMCKLSRSGSEQRHRGVFVQFSSERMQERKATHFESARTTWLMGVPMVGDVDQASGHREQKSRKAYRDAEQRTRTVLRRNAVEIAKCGREQAWRGKEGER